MAASVGSSFFKGETGRNTRGLLRLIILVLIAATAVASRLFSVIRFESIIHECTSTRDFPQSCLLSMPSLALFPSIHLLEPNSIF
ncbi:unnamed protein product [Aureobasidium uvarum]|uniref:Uncharacterized protein n=1 Tax=Aureobasidium uvarum TaxID=2773716 RepID=A0A9N8PPU2_9PEZI|nr:unnamed protein product [Aureobasidium uvarum]